MVLAVSLAPASPRAHSAPARAPCTDSWGMSSCLRGMGRAGLLQTVGCDLCSPSPWGCQRPLLSCSWGSDSLSSPVLPGGVRDPPSLLFLGNQRPPPPLFSLGASETPPLLFLGFRHPLLPCSWGSGTPPPVLPEGVRFPPLLLPGRLAPLELMLRANPSRGRDRLPLSPAERGRHRW